MGLQRKQGVPSSAGEQFDIRLTVEDFKRTVNMYVYWKPGMTIYVSHVRRKNIPNFVFPGGVRPAQPSKVTWDSRRASELKSSVEGKASPNGVDNGKKRKHEDDNAEANMRNVKCSSVVPASSEAHEGGVSIGSISSFSMQGDLVDGNSFGDTNIINSMKNQMEVNSPNDIQGNPTIKPVPPPADSSAKEEENVAIEKIMSGPYDTHQASPDELEELEGDFGNSNQIKTSEVNTKANSMESSASVAETALSASVVETEASTKAPTSPAVPIRFSSGVGSSVHGGLEELEVLSCDLCLRIMV